MSRAVEEMTLAMLYLLTWPIRAAWAWIRRAQQRRAKP